MLLQRTLTAIVLIVVLLLASLSSANWPLLVFFGVAASACLWEWMRMTLGGGRMGVSAVVALAFLCLTLLVSFQGAGAIGNTFPVTDRLRWFMAAVLLAWVLISGVSFWFVFCFCRLACIGLCIRTSWRGLFNFFHGFGLGCRYYRLLRR